MKLLTGNVSRTIDHLAKDMGTTPRTIYRYIDTIRMPKRSVISGIALLGARTLEPYS